MSTFANDNLVALLQHINLREETHGEEMAKAADLRFWLAPGEHGDQWESTLRIMMALDDDVDVSDHMVTYYGCIGPKGVPFSAAFELHTIKIWVGNSKVTELPGVKINRFLHTWATDKNDENLTFRVQTEVDGAQMGALTELLGSKVRLEILGPPQAEMNLDGDGDGNGEG